MTVEGTNIVEQEGYVLFCFELRKKRRKMKKEKRNWEKTAEGFCNTFTRIQVFNSLRREMLLSGPLFVFLWQTFEVEKPKKLLFR